MYLLSHYQHCHSTECSICDHLRFIHKYIFHQQSSTSGNENANIRAVKIINWTCTLKLRAVKIKGSTVVMAALSYGGVNHLK